MSQERGSVRFIRATTHIAKARQRTFQRLCVFFRDDYVNAPDEAET